MKPRRPLLPRPARALPACAALALALLAGCAAPGATALNDGGAPLEGTEALAQEQLAEGIALYDRGDYIDSLRRLIGSQAIAAGSLSTRVTARKYVAFSQCLLDRPEPCRESFDAILAMDPSFALRPAEIGHPLWGKAYLQAKAAAEQSATRGPGVVAEAGARTAGCTDITGSACVRR